MGCPSQPSRNGSRWQVCTPQSRPGQECEELPATPAPSPEEQPAHKASKELALPIRDLTTRGGGAWNLKGDVKWKKSGVDTFQGEQVLKVFYGKGSGTSKDPGVGGVSITAEPRCLPAREAVWAFDVFFDKGWDWSKGGKIGGLFVGHGAASGYEHSPTGSSHRIMWQRDGGAISYVYPPSGLKQEDPALKDDGHGIGYFRDVFPAGTLKVGQWNAVELGIRLNSFSGGKPNADGVAFLKINGRSAFKNDIRWARSPDLQISNVTFNTFFGGPDPATKDCVALYKNVRMLPALPR